MDAAGWGVLVALAIGIGSIWVSIWTTKHTAARELARRRRERRTDAYLQVLRLAEVRGQANYDRLYNLANKGLIDSQLVRKIKIAPPSQSDFAEAEALLAAFGSDRVRASHDEWVNAVADYDDEVDNIMSELVEAGWVLDPDTDRLGHLQRIEAARRRTLQLLVRSEI